MIEMNTIMNLCGFFVLVIIIVIADCVLDALAGEGASIIINAFIISTLVFRLFVMSGLLVW